MIIVATRFSEGLLNNFRKTAMIIYLHDLTNIFTGKTHRGSILPAALAQALDTPARNAWNAGTGGLACESQTVRTDVELGAPRRLLGMHGRGAWQQEGWINEIAGKETVRRAAAADCTNPLTL